MRSSRTRRTSVVTIVAFVALWWVLLAPPLLFGRTSYISVSGHSMEPTYFTGDLVVVRKASSYKPGDIVAFRANGGVVIHRVSGGDGSAGYETQGDNNSWQDPWRPTNADIVGKAWFRLPGASRWLLVLTQPAVLALLVTVVLALSLRPAKTSKPRRQPVAARATSRSPSTSTRRPMKLEELHRVATAIPRRTRVAAILATALAVALAVPAVLAWTDRVERSSFRETGRYGHVADFVYTFRMDPVTLYPDGVVGPIDASSPRPPVIYAKPARSMDVDIEYRFAADDQATATGTYTVDAVVSSEAGWSTTVPLVEPTPLDRDATQVEVTLDLASITDLVKRIGDESGAPSGRFDVTITPAFAVQSRVAATPIDERYAPGLKVSSNGATWAVTSDLHDEQTRRLGSEVTERVQLAGIDVALLRWAAAPAVVLLVLAALMVAAAARRVPRLTVEALLRRPGIAVIDLERPPADADDAVPLTSAEGIRRVAERDGGLVLRYEQDGDMLLYARHDDRVYCYSVESSSR